MLKTVGFPSVRTGDQTIVDGNLIIGTAGKGIDFSASSHAAGMTSELLNDYEEGTWTPIARTGWTSVTYTNQIGKYTKVGNIVTAWFYLQFSGTSNATNAGIGGLPFNTANNEAIRGGSMAYFDAPLNETTGILPYLAKNADFCIFYGDNDAGTLILSNGNASNDFFVGCFVYPVS